MPHIHLSMQAASDIILKRMRRRHLRSDGFAVIEKARRLRPGIAIGADLIAGFPTETDAAFTETIQFVRDAGIPYLHVFPYSERPGTPAARMPQVSKVQRKERALALRAEGERQKRAFLGTMVGREVCVLTEANGTGHTEHFAVATLPAQVPEGRLVKGVVTGVDASRLLVETN